jgi:hypothetical protein
VSLFHIFLVFFFRKVAIAKSERGSRVSHNSNIVVFLSLVFTFLLCYFNKCIPHNSWVRMDGVFYVNSCFIPSMLSFMTLILFKYASLSHSYMQILSHLSNLASRLEPHITLHVWMCARKHFIIFLSWYYYCSRKSIHWTI